MNTIVLFCRHNAFVILIVLATLPLFFINVFHSHDWGGDFAMYILQADNILQGKSMSAIPYIYNPDNPVLGPPAYPVGFPLMLVPVIAIWGANIRVLMLFMTFFLVLLGVFSAIFLKKFYSRITVFFMVLLITYNPWMLAFKMEIMSDLPFAVLLLLLTLLTIRKELISWRNAILLGFLGGLLIAVRIAGWVYPLAFMAWSIVLLFRHRGAARLLIPAKGAVVLVLSYLVYFLLNRIIFPVPAVEGASYTGIWATESVGVTILENLAYYIGVLEHFFNPDQGRWRFASLILRSFALTFFLLGIFNRMLKNFSFIEVLVLCYFAVIMIYPYRHGGFRFLLPVLPFIGYYIVSGLEGFRLERRMKPLYRALIIGVLVVSIYFNSSFEATLAQDTILQGPQEPLSRECFDHIRNHTPRDAVFVFFKPRVLALYTGRNSLANMKSQDSVSMKSRFESEGVRYVLVHKQYSDPAIREFVGQYTGDYILDWANANFILYRKIR